MRQSGSYSLVVVAAASLVLLLATEVASHKHGNPSVRMMEAKVNHLIHLTQAAKAQASKHEAGKPQSADLKACIAAYDEAINKLSQSIKFYEAHDINNFAGSVSEAVNQWHICEHQYVDNAKNPFGNQNYDLSNAATDILSTLVTN